MEASVQSPPVPLSRGRADYRATDARILRVAARMLTEDPHVSVVAIAEQAGVSRATMYRHYSSIHTIVEELRDRALAAEQPARGRLLEVLYREEPSASEIVSAYSAYLGEIFAALENDVAGPRGIVTWDPGLRAALAAELGPAARRAVARLQRLGVASTDFDCDTLLAMLAGSLLEGLRQVTVGDLPPQEGAALVQHATLIGLRARRRQAELAPA